MRCICHFKTPLLLGTLILPFFNFFPQPVFAQFQSGCQAGCPPQPSFTPPTSAQELVIEFRKSSSPFPFTQDFQQPVPLSQFNATAAVLSPALTQTPMRTWSNGEGQWKSLSNGSACLVSSSSKSSPSASVCTDSF